MVRYLFSFLLLASSSLFATTPPSPTNLQLTVESDSAIAASWQSGGENTAGFFIQIAAGGAAPNCTSGFALSKATTTYKFTGLSSGTQYTASICAFDLAGDISSPTPTPTPATTTAYKVGNGNYPSTANSWTSFTNGTANPLYTFGVSTLSDVRQWIGISGTITKQSFEYKDLIVGQTYSFNIYPAYITDSVTSWTATVVNGQAEITSGSSWNSPVTGFIQTAVRWQVQFKATSTSLTLELGSNQTTGTHYMYFNYFETEGGSGGTSSTILTAGTPSYPSTTSSWSSYTSSSNQPLYTFGSSALSNIRAWIGISGITTKQNFQLNNLIIGQTYNLNIYPAYVTDTTTAWLANVVSGQAQVTLGASWSSPVAGLVSTPVRWQVQFKASTTSVTFALGNSAANGTHYQYFNYFEVTSNGAQAGGGSAGNYTYRLGSPNYPSDTAIASAFTSIVPNAVYTVGESALSNLRLWIGVSGSVAKQNFLYNNLIAGQTYTLNIYPAFVTDTTTAWKANVTSGQAQVTSGASWISPVASTVISPVRWQVQFVPQSTSVTLTLGNDFTSGYRYMYFNYLEAIMPMSTAPAVSATLMASATTLTAPPPAPVNLTSSIDLNGGLSVSWSSGGGSTNGYKIAIAAKTSANCLNGTDIGAKTTAYFPRLTPLSTIYIQVCAYNTNAQYSKAATITTTSKEFVRGGDLESEKQSEQLWDEFKSTDTNPTYTFTENDESSLRSYIGSLPSSPNQIYKQTIRMKNLVPGKLQSLRLYAANASSSSAVFVAQLLSGNAEILNSSNGTKTATFNSGYVAVGDVWNIFFVPTSLEITIEFSRKATTGSDYLYIDAWDYIVYPNTVPSNMFVHSGNWGVKLLGEAIGNSTRYSPKWRIPYNDNKFNTPNDPTLRQSRLSTVIYASKFAYDKKVPVGVIESFQGFANRMILGTEQPGKWIDDAFDEVRNKWAACGGKYLNVANGLAASSIFATVQPSYWLYSGSNYSGYIAGQANWPSRHVLGNVVGINNLMSVNPAASTGIQNFQRLMAWEIGNIFGLYSGFYPGNTLSSEIGNASPCGK